jgi:hypothetical protein
MRPVLNWCFGVVACGLATIPAGHASDSGLGAGFISLLAVCVLIEVFGWVIGRG